MMEFKRITLMCGHYGSGKTNVAVNLAYELKKQHENTAIADLDIVNPYFRTIDSEAELTAAGIRVIRSQYAGTNLDAPAMPQEMYAIVEDESMKTVIDVGGDDRGAFALGRLSRAITERGDYEMLMVINSSRPLTRDAESTIEVMREIETACRIPFTGIVNNTNLGRETTAETVLNSLPYAEEVSRLAGLPVVMTTVRADIAEELEGKVENLLPLTLQNNMI